MKIMFKVQMTTQYMFDFMLQHIYRSFQGIFSILAGLGVLTLFICTLGKTDTVYSLCYLFFGIFFLLYLPFSLWSKAKRQVKLTPMFKKPLEYEVDQRGIRTSQDEQSEFVPWKNVQKVINSKLCVIVYISKVRAFVWPKEAIGDRYDQLLEMMKKNASAKAYKIRRK